MDYFSTLFDKKNMPQLVLSVLFVLYLLIGYKMPDNVANVVDSTAGKIIVAIVALFLFGYSNPVLGVLGLLVAYQIISSASSKTGMSSLEQYYPTQERVWTPFTAHHQFEYTLEQEVVKNMASQKFNQTYVQAPWKPVLEDTYDASPINA